MTTGPRFGLISTLKGTRPSRVAQILLINLLVTVGLFMPILVFNFARGLERDDVSRDKLPWLRWFGNAGTSVAISWETEQEATSSLAFGSDPDTLVNNVTLPGLRTMHHVYINGLVPGTRYYYTVASTDGVYSFWTAPATSNGSFTFLAIADTQESTLGINHHPRVAKALAREVEAGAKFLIHGGDFADSGYSKPSWQYYFKHAAPYAPYLPICPTIGNHDGRFTPYHYKEYLMFNSSYSPLNYSFDYGPVHVASIPVPYGEEWELSQSEPYWAWLDDDLNKSSASKFKIVVFHCPVISSGFFGRVDFLVDNLHPILAKHNVTLVINGHSHHYERLVMDGVTYVVIGGGGGVMNPCHVTLPQTQALHNLPHYVRIHVDPAIGMQYEAVTPDGVVFDATTLGGAA